jgi:hypothetical protein
MTIMYIAIQETLNDPEDMSLAHGKLCMMARFLNVFDSPLINHSGSESVLGRLYDDSHVKASLGRANRDASNPGKFTSECTSDQTDRSRYFSYSGNLFFLSLVGARSWPRSRMQPVRWLTMT